MSEVVSWCRVTVQYMRHLYNSNEKPKTCILYIQSHGTQGHRLQICSSNVSDKNITMALMCTDSAKIKSSTRSTAARSMLHLISSQKWQVPSKDWWCIKKDLTSISDLWLVTCEELCDTTSTGKPSNNERARRKYCRTVFYGCLRNGHFSSGLLIYCTPLSPSFALKPF